ncbi:MAG: ABC transporter permease [Geminicoccaceae bacterium]
MSASLKISSQEDAHLLCATGDWCLPSIAALDSEVRGFLASLNRENDPARKRVRLVLDRLGRMDTAGAWLVARTIRELRTAEIEVEIIGADDEHRDLIDLVHDVDPRKPEPDEDVHTARRIVEKLGEGLIFALKEAYELVSFFGALMSSLFVNLLRPKNWRLTSVMLHIEETGVNAIPIVTLMSFLIGVVLAYQGSSQLAQFGAEIFTVNLLAVSVLRELGILMTAIIVAGRSGSAFTAQIGMMKVNEEIDAMRVIGLDPLEILVTPRVIALLIALPLLFFLAVITALAGGALVVIFALDIPTVQFMRQLQEASGLDTFLVGLVKAPVFAFLIAMVGCYEGLRVENNAASVGTQTTKSVVVTIFLVIIVDAVFSIMFSILGI